MNELGPDARKLVEAGRDDDQPSVRDRERIRARLIAELGAAAFASAAVSAPATVEASTRLPRTMARSLWARPLIKLAAVAGAAGSLYVGSSLLRTPQPMPSPRVPALPQASPPDEEPEQPSPPDVPEARPSPEPPASEAPPERAARQRRKSAPHAPVLPPKEPAEVVPKPTLSAELRLLARAQRALRSGEASEALALAHEHAERFPDGALGEERAGIEALARCMLGDRSQAAARSFLARAPSSPLSTRVRKECEIDD